MTVEKCPFPLPTYHDGHLQVDGWDEGSFTLGFLNINYCESSRFDAELYGASGNAGEISMDGGSMDAKSLDFTGTFTAYADKAHNYRHIVYKAEGKYVS